MDNSVVYWIWLQQVLGYGSNKIRTVNLLFDKIEDFYYASENDRLMCGCFTRRELDLMEKTPIMVAENILKVCDRSGIQVISINNDLYPERLKNIVNPPSVLYLRGKIPKIDNNLSISIVGTRDASLYGEKMAFDISYGLAKNGTVIVSGAAVGVDSAAHRGALRAGGKTIAVLGCGLDFPYLMTNSILRKAISENGALLSEYPPNFAALRRNFPVRNRIISGLSLGTLVVEAGEKSGSLITANLSAEQNRDVFAVPVDLRTSNSLGTLNLIRDGAKIITKADDILEEYSHLDFNSVIVGNIKKNDYFKVRKKLSNKVNNSRFNVKKQKNIPNTVKNDESILKEVSENSKKIYKFLDNGVKHIDEISLKVDLSVNEVLSALTQLEIFGLVKSYPGKFYSKAV